MGKLRRGLGDGKYDFVHMISGCPQGAGMALPFAARRRRVFPIRHFYQRWGATIAIERRPSVAARLHAA